MIESFNKKELEEKIDLYINGQLSSQEVDELWSELIQDGYHLDYLKSAANLKAVVERKREERKAQKKKKYWYYAAAAVIALLITVLGVMNFSFQGDDLSVQPVASVELDYYRSGDGVIDASGDREIIQDAISLANTGQMDEAISLLNGELNNASEPDWIAELSLSLGSLHYNDDRYDEAISYYRNVIDHREHVDPLMVEKAYWYIGNAYFHMDELSEAQENIREAYELNGAYRRVAKSYLDALAE